ncbi:MAG: type II secretion system F family protein [Candidatus Omnitrophica bacterium]|nr:type II secretion system F family protein [Candidatus Omnitrophota bacterium]
MVYFISLLFIFTAIFILVISLFPKRSEQRIRERLISESEGEKKKREVILDLLIPLNKRLNLPGLKQGLQKRLVCGGVELTADQFLSLKEIASVLCGLFYLLISKGITPLHFILSLVVGFFLPDLWLRNKIQKRQQEIRRALPDVVDLLSLSVEAGLDFMLAVNRVVRESKLNPFIEELGRMWQETRIGRSRREALLHMGERIDIPDVSSFVRTLVQAERMGTSIAEALHNLSQEVRLQRFQRGEKLALQAPVKLLIPLMLFILPVVLIIVAGPILLQFMKQGIG